jgi:hypothetical protein
MTPRRSPWFNARRDPPVNGGDDAVYERRCTAFPERSPWMAKRIDLLLTRCDRCQWRGLLREESEK